MRAAVLGTPVAHSRSPVLHSAAYAALGLHDWSYERVECDTDALPSWVAGCDAQWAGLSVTMPLKAAVAERVDRTAGQGEALGVVNTVTIGDDDGDDGDTSSDRHRRLRAVPGCAEASQ